MDTPKFLEFITNNVGAKYPDGVDQVRLFFGYSDYTKKLGGERVRWQAAVLKLYLGVTATKGQLHYQLYTADTDPKSGVFVSTHVPESTDGNVVIPGVVGDQRATVRPDGHVEVLIQNASLTPSHPQMY